MGSQKPRTDHLPDLVSFGLLSFMVLWFGHEMITQGKVPFFRDLGPYFYPMRWSLAESFANGELPLWNRHMAAGFPLLADFQAGAFYPLHLTFLILPFFSAISTIFLFHYLLAATGSYLLCRHWGYPPYLSIVGAVLFTFGGVVVSLSNLLNHFQAAVWLPWVVLFAERSFCSCSWRNFLGFTLMLLLQFLAGSPEIYAMSMALVIVDSLRLKTSSPEIGLYKRIVLMVLGGNALVATLAMVQIAPTLELFLQSRRTQPIPYSEAIDWSLKPSNLFNLFFLDKEVDTTVLPGMRLFFLSRASFFVSYYLGAVSLFGACFWALYSSSKERVITLALVVLTLAFAFGGYTPFYPFILHSFPIIGVVRFPEKFFFLTYSILWFSILRGLFVFFEKDVLQKKHSFTILLSIFLVHLFIYVFLRLQPELLSQFIASQTESLILSGPTATATGSVIVSVERQVLLSLGFVILFFAARRKITRAALLQVLLIALVFIDLERAHREYQYLLDPTFVYKGSRVIAKPETGSHRVFYYPAGKTLHPAEYSVLGRPSFKEAISLVFSNLLPNSGVFHGFDYFQEIDALSRQPYLTFLTFADRADPERRIRLLGALNVYYLMSFRPLPTTGVTLVDQFPQYPSWLYAVDRVVPRSYVVAETEAEKSAQKTLERLSSVDFDAKRTVILDRLLSRPSNKNFQAQARIVHYENQTVIVQASLNSPGVLVLADSHYPGWKAYVDGREEEILRANLFFRAVPLAAGEHTVEFQYEPLSFEIGLVISLMTLSGLLIFSLGLYVRKKRQSRPMGGR